MTSRAANSAVESSACRLNLVSFFSAAVLFCLYDGLVDSFNQRTVRRDEVRTLLLDQSSPPSPPKTNATPCRSIDLRTGVAGQYV